MTQSKIKTVLHKRSDDLNTQGNAPKLPQANQLAYGEIAINYASGNEAISFKNSDNEIVALYVNNDYVTSDTLENYVTNDTLSSTLDNYVTSDELGDYVTNDVLNDYVTNGSLSDTLDNYVTSDTLNNTLEDYVTKEQLIEDEEVIASGMAKVRDVLGVTETVQFNPSSELLRGVRSFTEAIDKVIGNTAPLVNGKVPDKYINITASAPLTVSNNNITHNTITGNNGVSPYQIEERIVGAGSFTISHGDEIKFQVFDSDNYGHTQNVTDRSVRVLTDYIIAGEVELSSTNGYIAEIHISSSNFFPVTVGPIASVDGHPMTINFNYGDNMYIGKTFRLIFKNNFSNNRDVEFNVINSNMSVAPITMVGLGDGVGDSNRITIKRYSTVVCDFTYLSVAENKFFVMAQTFDKTISL